MDIWNLALNLGAAEAFSLAPQAVEAHWPGTVGDPDALLPGATAVHLLIVPYQTFAWREDEPSVNAFIPPTKMDAILRKSWWKRCRLRASAR